jgi:hypothetical protein
VLPGESNRCPRPPGEPPVNAASLTPGEMPIGAFALDRATAPPFPWKAGSSSMTSRRQERERRIYCCLPRNEVFIRRDPARNENGLYKCKPFSIGVGGRLRDRACQIAGDQPTCAPTVIRPASRCSDPAPPTDRPPSNQRAHSTSLVCCRPLYRLAPNSDLPVTLVSGRGRWRR